MGISTNKDFNHVLGRKYNVEYLDGRGRCQTFNNILTNIDNTYFWFENEEDGLALVRQDRVTFMYCTDKPRHNKNTNLVYTITYNGETNNELDTLIDKAMLVDCNAIQIYVPIGKKVVFENNITKGKIPSCKDIEVIQYKGCNVLFNS